eukprot:5566438-Pleurochrysis_carterae.AAC.3
MTCHWTFAKDAYEHAPPAAAREAVVADSDDAPCLGADDACADLRISSSGERLRQAWTGPVSSARVPSIRAV